MATRFLLNLISILIHILCLLPLQQTTSFNNQTDLHSLLAIKSAIDHDPFGALDSWNKTTHFCRWNGIQCGRRHPDRVVGIHLMSLGLVGTLSPFVGNLSFLISINLQNNTFNGPIPPQIGLLRRLDSLILQNNSFVGTIPTNLSQCLNLRHLSLSDNELSGVIPTELGSLSELQVLVLARNNLSGPIPPSIGNLTLLIQLSLLSCGLKGEIPKSFAQFRHLVFLQISDNHLTGTIPTALFNISTIQFFYAAGNELSGVLPSTLGITLANLRGLYLWGNKFSGPIPLSISNASFLGQLDLSLNSLTGPIPRVGGLTRLRNFIFESNLLEDDMSFISSLINSTELEAVGVGDNMLRGSLPDSIANLSSRLSGLSMSGNMISGRIPSGIGNLIGLTFIIIGSNDLDGPIPTSIGKLSVLNTLDARANRLTNALPSSFGNLTSLNILYLSENKLSGNLPSNLGNCTNLNDLDLSRNNFSGRIPPDILSLSSVSIMFNLSYNNFDGSIPNEVGLMKNLGALDLSNNRLSGLVSDSLGQCTSLETLNLQENLLEGAIPAGMSALIALQYLDLSRNNLSGPIPDFLGELKLERLNLSFNRLQGEVPIMGVFKNETSISLYGNELCGGIPELKLPPCSLAESQKRNLPTPLKILIPTLVAGGICLMLLAVVFITYRRRKSRKNVTPATHFIGIEIMRLSYTDLVRATGGFCEANLLGGGRFGSVYKGILEDGETQVAVKVLNLSVRGASKSFLSECNALRNVRHRNILKLLSVCESIDFQGNEFKALVYEFKANGSLEKWLYHRREEEEEEEEEEREEINSETKSLDLIQRLNIAIDIAQALEYLHIGTDSSIVHGDLKPSNILLDDDMMAYVGDFGLAKIMSDMAPTHDSNSIGIAGTLGYLAPEYATNNFISSQGDMYSYGILLLEMFTNKRPTEEEFYDHINLHSFVSNAFPNHILKIVDQDILRDLHMNPKIKDCLEGTLRIGIACSRTVPRDRMSITDVVKDLRKIRVYYLS